MLGQSLTSRCSARIRRSWLGCLTICALILCVTWSLAASSCLAEESTVRLRFAWGSTTSSKHLWRGEISVDGASLSDLQPLGVEADAPIALRLEDGRLLVDPLIKRGFDGCDVTVRGDEQAMVRVRLQSDQSPQPMVVEAPLAEIANSPIRSPLDQLGSYLLASRCPGDKLRVDLERDHLVFRPGETWSFQLRPDLAAELAEGPIRIDVRLMAGSDLKNILWQSNRQLTSEMQTAVSSTMRLRAPRLKAPID